MPNMTQALSPRERILETATQLFYAHGYRAIGVDRLILESGVAKMTFYKHFPSKDSLIQAYLEKSTTGFWTWINSITEKYLSPREQLIAIFQAVAKQAISPACLGCAFLHAAAEFPEVNHPAHQTALEYKRGVLAKLEALSQEAGAANPKALSEDLMLLMDGAWAAARMFGAGNHAARVAQTAEILIDVQTSKK